MLLVLPKLLDAKALKTVDTVLSKAVFAAGALSAGETAKKVKNNLQLDPEKTKNADKLEHIVLEALRKNTAFQTAAIPKLIRTPMYSKYTEGMGYGVHVDNPVMGGGGVRMRTDLSMTLFLSEPGSYQGGELVIRTENGEARVKLPKGDAVIYSTGALHAVNTVSKGQRLAAVTWIQSIIADPYRRQIAAELDAICQSLTRKMPGSEELHMLTRNYGNLVRLWGEV